MDLLQFGIAISQGLYRFFVFEPLEDEKGWAGCIVREIAEGTLDCEISLREFITELNIIHIWASVVFIPGVQRDLKICMD